MRPTSIVAGICLASTLLGGVGCAPLPPLFGTLGGPHELTRQREAVNNFDPFPEDRTAPVIDGARPPGFEHPLSEPERVRRKPSLTE